jgi:uncharacterized protein YcbK (DUF882 family)
MSAIWRRVLCVGFGAALCAAPLESAFADAPSLDAASSAASGASRSPKKGGKRKLKRRARPVFSGRLASPSELRDDPLDRPSGHIELASVNFHETVEVDLYREDGSFDPEALDTLNHLWRCRRTQTEKSIDPRLFEMLSRIWDHFHTRIELVSGYRNQKRTSSFHFHGSASDIRVPGVTDRQLHAFVSTLDTGGMGIGIYPRAGFIHVDIRPEPSYRWVDYSPPGTSDMGRPHTRRLASSKGRGASTL